MLENRYAVRGAVSLALDGAGRHARTSVCDEDAEHHNAVGAAPQRRRAEGAHDGAEDHVACQEREEDGEGLIFP